jgi:hypothetical protein
MNKPAQELLDLAFFALDHAIKSMVRTNGPLVPFAILESANGERALARFMPCRNPELAREHSRAHVAQTSDCVKYAIAADGVVNENGRRIPVVLVEAGERGKSLGFSFIRRLASNSDSQSFEPVRNRDMIDHAPILRLADC